MQAVGTEEALTFATWKMPSVITYQERQSNNKIDDEWKNNIDTKLLYMDVEYVGPQKWRQ